MKKIILTEGQYKYIISGGAKSSLNEHVNEIYNVNAGIKLIDAQWESPDDFWYIYITQRRKDNRDTFVKNHNASGSKTFGDNYIAYGIVQGNTKEEAIEGLKTAKELSSDGKCICEKYMGDKQDIASAFFVVDGEPYMVKFGDRYLGKPEDGLDKQVMCTKFPSDFTPVFEEKVQQRVKDMIKALGIKFGPVFLQGFADGDTMRYYDPALRMPGGDYDLVLKEATGFDTVKSLIHFALTGDTKTYFGNPKDCFKLNGGVGMIICFSVRPGHIKKVEGFEKLMSQPNVVYGRQIIPEGEDIPASGDIRQRVAAVGAYVKNKQEAEEFVKKMYDIYHVYDEKGEDMIVSKYEYKA